ncbi:MAG: hypothetical protein RR784_08060, partial [Burkholderiaceae bacterium]
MKRVLCAASFIERDTSRRCGAARSHVWVNALVSHEGVGANQILNTLNTGSPATAGWVLGGAAVW